MPPSYIFAYLFVFSDDALIHNMIEALLAEGYPVPEPTTVTV